MRKGSEAVTGENERLQQLNCGKRIARFEVSDNLRAVGESRRLPLDPHCLGMDAIFR